MMQHNNAGNRKLLDGSPELFEAWVRYDDNIDAII